MTSSNSSTELPLLDKPAIKAFKLAREKIIENISEARTGGLTEKEILQMGDDGKVYTTKLEKKRIRGERTSKILLNLSKQNSNFFSSTGICLTDITSITLFKKFITDIMNTTGLKEALKKKNRRIGTIVDDE